MDYPKRKHPRLKEYDYASNGYYHVILHADQNKPIFTQVGSGFSPEAMTLTTIGAVAEEQLFALEDRYAGLRIDQYVIMPTHLHLILVLCGETAGASPRPTLTDIICTYKSLTTRLCNQQDHTPGRKIFQTSFYDHVIRNEQAYQKVWQYIDNNRLQWELDNAPDRE